MYLVESITTVAKCCFRRLKYWQEPYEMDEGIVRYVSTSKSNIP